MLPFPPYKSSLSKTVLMPILTLCNDLVGNLLQFNFIVLLTLIKWRINFCIMALFTLPCNHWHSAKKGLMVLCKAICKKGKSASAFLSFLLQIFAKVIDVEEVKKTGLQSN